MKCRARAALNLVSFEMSVFRGELNKVGRDDMITLDASDNAAIVDNLKRRFDSSIIYTNIGAVVISLNPFKNLDVFSKSNIVKYKGKQAYEVPPHIFVLAEQSFRALLTEGRSQAVIISGESGAGKTEAAKGESMLFVCYLAHTPD
jgi:myosin-1